MNGRERASRPAAKGERHAGRGTFNRMQPQDMMWSVLIIASSILPNLSGASQSPFFQRRLSSVALLLHEHHNTRRRHYYSQQISNSHCCSCFRHDSSQTEDAAGGIIGVLLAEEDDTAIITSSSSSSSRRSFLKHYFSVASITTAPMILLPTLLAFAYNDEDDDRSVIDEDSTTAATTIIDTTNEEVAAAVANVNGNNNNKVAIDKLVKEENELLNNIIQEEQVERRLIEEEGVLIDELVNEIQQYSKESNTISSDTSDIDGSLSSITTNITQDKEVGSKIKLDMEVLIKEEERIKNETMDIITKLQDMESQVQSLDIQDSAVVVDDENKSSTTDNSDTAAAATTTTVEVIVDKLKERVTQKEDLITRLKQQSLERDIDPKTGKYRVMTPLQYKQRVQSTDVDFIQFLKDTIGNEKEIKADLNAFEGMIVKEIGPLMLEIQKDISPMVKAVEKEWDKDGVPVMKEMLQQLKDTTHSNNEVDEVQQRVGDLIDKLRSMF